jgi:hypothetical protein
MAFSFAVACLVVQMRVGHRAALWLTSLLQTGAVPQSCCVACFVSVKGCDIDIARFGANERLNGHSIKKPFKSRETGQRFTPVSVTIIIVVAAV